MSVIDIECRPEPRAQGEIEVCGLVHLTQADGAVRYSIVLSAAGMDDLRQRALELTPSYSTQPVGPDRHGLYRSNDHRGASEIEQLVWNPRERTLSLYCEHAQLVTTEVTPEQLLDAVERFFSER